MPLYKLGTGRMTAIEGTTLAAANVKGQHDLQRWLGYQIEIIVPDGVGEAARRLRKVNPLNNSKQDHCPLERGV